MEPDNQPSIFKDCLLPIQWANHIHDTTKWTRSFRSFLSCVSHCFLYSDCGRATIEPALASTFPGLSNIMGSVILVAAIVFFLVFGH
jgi:hypothetical protein